MATTLGLRYPGTAFHHGQLNMIANIGTGFNSVGPGIIAADPELFGAGEASRVYLAPNRYSQVRRVVFWITFRHVHAGVQPTYTVRGRIAPSSTLSTSISLESLPFLPSSIQRTAGTGKVWSAGGGSGPTAKAAVYQQVGQNTVIPRKVLAANTTTDAQIVYIEFDRFETGSTDFFNDWDSVTDDDDYIAYWPLLERVDQTAWAGGADVPPLVTGMGCSVVQAPGNPNNSCTMFPASNGLLQQGAIATTYGAARPVPFIYNALDWDNIESIHLIHRQTASDGVTNRGNFDSIVGTIEHQVAGVTNIAATEETFNDQTAAAGTVFLARSMDLKDFLVDGGVHIVDWKSGTGVNQDLPWSWWEVIQKTFRKKVMVHFAGQAVPNLPLYMKPNPPAPATWAEDEALFDPLWYTGFTEELILKQQVWGGMGHNSAANDTASKISMNADMGADISTSVFTQQIDPELSSTPNATLGLRVLESDIQANNPILVAGKRKLKQLYTGPVWDNGGTDVAGAFALIYQLNVPLSEFLERGPVFELGSFNPEGCASTAAGLGDPGVLVITNGSTIPKKFVASKPAADAIEDNGVPVPYSGEVPATVVNNSVASPDGGLGIGIYIYRYTFRNCCTGKESEPNPDEITVDTTGASPSASVTLGFAGVRIPADPQICEICIYRTSIISNPNALAKVGCFDPDVTDVFIDDLSDAALDFLLDGLSISLNFPMPCVPIVVEFNNFLFGFGDIPQLSPAGTVSAVIGSDIIVGSDNVEWDRCLEGKYIKLDGDCMFREIIAVLPPTAGVSPPIGRLRLLDEYDGPALSNVNYIICGHPNRLYVSEPLEPECWPVVNFIDVEPGDGDRLMGGVSNFGRLVLCKRNKTYVMTFRFNPVLEGATPTRVSSDIGCVGPRTFAQVESGSVWLSDRGIAIYDGRTVMHLKASDEMNDLFIDPDNPNYMRRDSNGRVIDAVGVFYPKREQYLLLIPTVQTSRGCNLMIVWDTKLSNITILKFCQEFQSMVVGKDTDGNERVYMGDVNGFVWLFDIGTNDGVGVPNATGTVRGTVTSAGVEVGGSGASFMEDSAASFITGGLPELAGLSGTVGLSGAVADGDLGIAGACVWIRPPGAALDDPYQVRTIYAATPTKLFVTPNWDEDTPVEGSEYMLGPIEFKCVFKPNNYGTDDVLKRPWGQVLTYKPEVISSQVRVEILPDFSQIDEEELTVLNEIDGEIVTGAGRIFDMSFPRGRQTRPIGREIFNYEAIRITNVAPDEPVSIINHVIRATPKISK